jgi:hypothetical protein
VFNKDTTGACHGLPLQALNAQLVNSLALSDFSCAMHRLNARRDLHYFSCKSCSILIRQPKNPQHE